MLDALNDRDYPVVSAVNGFFATVVVFVNLLTDLRYASLDADSLRMRRHGHTVTRNTAKRVGRRAVEVLRAAGARATAGPEAPAAFIPGSSKPPTSIAY